MPQIEAIAIKSEETLKMQRNKNGVNFAKPSDGIITIYACIVLFCSTSIQEKKYIAQYDQLLIIFRSKDKLMNFPW